MIAVWESDISDTFLIPRKFVSHLFIAVIFLLLQLFF